MTTRIFVCIILHSIQSSNKVNWDPTRSVQTREPSNQRASIDSVNLTTFIFVNRLSQSQIAILINKGLISVVSKEGYHINDDFESIGFQNQRM